MVRIRMQSFKLDPLNGIAGFNFGAKKDGRKNPKNKLRRVQGVNARRTGTQSLTTNSEVFKDLDAKYAYVDRVLKDDTDSLLALAVNSKLNDKQRSNSATEAFIRPLRNGLLGKSEFRGSLKGVTKNVGVDTGQLIQTTTCEILHKKRR